MGDSSFSWLLQTGQTSRVVRLVDEAEPVVDALSDASTAANLRNNVRYEPKTTRPAITTDIEIAVAFAVHRLERYLCMNGLWRYSDTSHDARNRFTTSWLDVRARDFET